MKGKDWGWRWENRQKQKFKWREDPEWGRRISGKELLLLNKPGRALRTGSPIACFLPVPVKDFMQATRVELWEETFKLRYPKETLGLLINAWFTPSFWSLVLQKKFIFASFVLLLTSLKETFKLLLMPLIFFAHSHLFHLSSSFS